MTDHGKTPHLEHDHHETAIRSRLAGDGGGHGTLSHGVLGAMDGSITTFTIVAGAVGGGLAGSVVVILGLAKVVADALSMAVSDFLSTRSERQEVDRARSMEQRHIDAAPDGERAELREIFRRKGITGQTLDEVVAMVAADRRAWVETMVKEEHHLCTETTSPLRGAATTFGAFLAVGVVPLLPFLVAGGAAREAFAVSAAITGALFVLVGLVRAVALGVSRWRSALETLLTGTAAALVAYGVGAWLRASYGVG